MKDKITAEAIEEYLGRLEATPRRIGACTAGVAEGRLKAAPGPKAWSVVEHLAHLRACDEVWAHTVYAMLMHAAPTLPVLNPRDWAKTARYASLDLELVPSVRAEAGGVSAGAARAEGRRVGARGTTGGITRIPCCSQVRRTAVHEVVHCEEIEGMMRRGT